MRGSPGTGAAEPRALVVYESMLGNVEEVALAVAEGVRGVMSLVVEVAEAPADLRGVDLVVASGPTHAYSMGRATTRRDARAQGATHGSIDSGPREWLSSLADEHGLRFAAFDTRVSKDHHCRVRSHTVPRRRGLAASGRYRRQPTRALEEDP